MDATPFGSVFSRYRLMASLTTSLGVCPVSFAIAHICSSQRWGNASGNEGFGHRVNGVISVNADGVKNSWFGYGLKVLTTLTV